jgi:uncharacterized protein with ParB-like and HNH nuclease domain
MKFLTEDHDLAVISVLDLADALTGEKRTIQLPVFQRDAVWDEAHISLLWDSLLRDFPIGSLLFARADGVYKPVSLPGAAGEINKSTATKYIIIDGQQRANAIALGLTPWIMGDPARL